MTNKDALLVRFAQNTEYLVGILEENTCVGCPARKQCDGEESGKSWQCSRILREWLDTSIGGEADNKPAESHDKISHPAYYTQGIEAAEYIASHKMDFFTGNIVKYITRAGLKDPATKREDLLKARWYLDYLIEHTGEAEK